jgi:hypothetical protein
MKISVLKKAIWRIDRILLGERFRKIYDQYIISKARKANVVNFERGFEVRFNRKINCELSRLCDLYGSDKGELVEPNHPYPWKSHEYTKYYSQLFRHCRKSITKVFECGIGTNNPNLPSSMGASGKPGASLRVWRDYFPYATIYGADIDTEILFKEERIRTFYIDQLDSRTIESFWEEVAEIDFDLMVDAGLHTFEAGKNLFMHSKDKLAPNGIYIIEDVSDSNLLAYRKFFSNLKYDAEYVIFDKKVDGSGWYNLVVIRNPEPRF